MKSDLELKIEMTEKLYRFALAIRKMKSCPELAGEAARREMEFSRDLERLKQERAAQEQPSLLEAV